MLAVGDIAALPFAADTFQAVVTSPPYWMARDYGYGTGQLGLEPRVDVYVRNLVTCFDEVRRVLRPDGVLWVVLGDSYNTRAKIRATAHNPGLGHTDAVVGISATQTWKERSAAGMVKHSARAGSNLKDKDLAMVPSRFAVAMVDAGWYLRAEIIWAKPFSKPEKVKDRPTLAHEKIFMFTRREQYAFTRTEATKRSVWTISPGSGLPGVAGPAVFPALLVEYCLQASTSPGDLVLDPFAGAGVTLHTATRMGRPAVGVDLSAEWWTPTAPVISPAQPLIS